LLTTPHHKKYEVKNRSQKILGTELKFGTTSNKKKILTFGSSKVRSLYRSGFFTTADRGLARYKLDLVVVQKVKWDKEAR